MLQVAPVDLLKCSFMHCPSPSSSVDTLTNTNTRQTNNQFSFGHRECGADESFQNLSEASRGLTCPHLAQQVMTTNHGEHVIISTKQDYDTDKSYGLTLARAPYARDRWENYYFLSIMDIFFLYFRLLSRTPC